jgi:hypothetical protein
MLDEQAYVDELGSLELIEELESTYLRVHGCPTINVSSWDPSAEFKAELEGTLDIPVRWPSVDYVFSYDIERSGEILNALGFSPDAVGWLITPSGSVSIVCVVNWLAAMGFGELTVLFPAYFSLRHICRRCGVAIRQRFMVRKRDTFRLPELNEQNFGPPGVLWITNPTYATGVHWGERETAELYRLLDRGWYIVADECLAIAGNELGTHFGGHPNFIGIYAPHKSVCVNAVKFSLLTFHAEYQRFYDHWADVLYGCLGSSAVAAIDHYLSINFSEYSNRFIGKTNHARAFVAGLCQSLSGVELDSTSIGQFGTCYFPSLSSSLGNNLDFLRSTINSTGGSFIPGNRNHFDDALGFNFRINFAQDSPLFRSTLTRLIEQLSKQATGQH